MNLLAGMFAGLFVFLLFAQITGNMPKRLSSVQESRKRMTRYEERQSWLNQSGAGVTPFQFWAISFGAGVAAFSVLFITTQVFMVAFIPAVMVGWFPRAYFSRKRTKVIAQRVESWPDALRTLVASISASQSLHQALKGLGTNGPLPLRPVFSKYSRLTQALDQKSALEVVKEEIADPMSDRIIEVLIAATEAGPGVVLDILRDLANATTSDLQLREHIETMQTEQKLNARVVFVLPFLLLVMMVMSSPIIREFYQSLGGIFIIFLGTGILTFGMYIVQVLSKIPTEQRVFAASTKKADEEIHTSNQVKSDSGAADFSPLERFS